MEKLQTRISESKKWLQENSKIVIAILLLALILTSIRVMTFKSQLDDCAASVGKTAIEFKLPKLN